MTLTLAHGGAQIIRDAVVVNDDWKRGTNAAGEHGLFPANYVEPIVELVSGK